MALYTTHNEAVEREIRAALESSADLTGPIDDAFDIDAIADETITMVVFEGGGVFYCQDSGIDGDRFWEIVEKHAR